MNNVMADYKNLSDTELADLLKESDHAAYKEIYDRYHYLMLVHAYKKLRGGDLAKDMVQDLFTNLWLKRGQIPTTNNLPGYLYVSLRNSILNYFAHLQVESKFLASLSTQITLQNTVHTDHLVRQKEIQSYIDQEIAALPAKMRKVFELSKMGHLSYKEIAETLSISENTVNSQMVNAFGRLRTKLALYMSLLF